MTNESFQKIRDNVKTNYQNIIALTEIEKDDLNNMELLPLLYIMAERTGKDNTVIQQHIKNNFFQNEQEEENLIFYLFLNSLTPEEKKSFEGILSDILPKSKQGEEYLKNIFQSSLANPQIYEGWGFGFKMNEGEPIKTIDGTTKYIEVEVTQVFEGSKLKDQGVNKGDKIRVQITEDQLQSIDLTDIGQVAAVIRGAEQISVVRKGEENKTELNQDQKGIFALGEKNKHTSFENLSEERVKKCFTEAKQEFYKAQSPGTSPKRTIDATKASEKLSQKEEGVVSL